MPRIPKHQRRIKSLSFRLTEKDKVLLRAIASEHNRSQANMISELIKEEAARLNIEYVPKEKEECP